MELFSIDPETFEQELAHYDLRLHEVIRAYPPNCTYACKGADKRSPLACGIIISYGLLEPAVIGALPIPVVTMAFMVKPVRDKAGLILTQMVRDIPISTLHETADTPDLWYERTYKMRHPLNWLDLQRVGTKQAVMDQGTVRTQRVVDAEAVDKAQNKES